MFSDVWVVGPWEHIKVWNLVNIGSGHGFLPDGTKPLPETMLTYLSTSPYFI